MRLERARTSSAPSNAWKRLEADVEAAQRRFAERAASRPAIVYPPELPVSQRAGEIAQAIARHQVVIVSGEGGVGKSRLVRELGARAERRAWKIAYGRAFPVESGIPYALLSDAFLPILRELDKDTLTLLTRGGADELRYLFPALGRPAIAGEAAGEPDEVRTRLMWNFAEFLKSYAARSPLLVILALQAILAMAWAWFVSFWMMGRDYESAVMAAGFCGFMMGSTATAIANMQALIRRYGPAPQAMLVIPLAGAFFIDLVNALVLSGFLALSLVGG